MIVNTVSLILVSSCMVNSSQQRHRNASSASFSIVQSLRMIYIPLVPAGLHALSVPYLRSREGFVHVQADFIPWVSVHVLIALGAGNHDGLASLGRACLFAQVNHDGQYVLFHSQSCIQHCSFSSTLGHTRQATHVAFAT